jgi:hypothetical protein
MVNQFQGVIMAHRMFTNVFRFSVCSVSGTNVHKHDWGQTHSNVSRNVQTSRRQTHFELPQTCALLFQRCTLVQLLHKMQFLCLFKKENVDKLICGNRAVWLCWEGSHCEFLPGQRLSRLRCFVILLSLSGKRLGHTTIRPRPLPYSSSFISHSTIRRCIVKILTQKSGTLKQVYFLLSRNLIWSGSNRIAEEGFKSSCWKTSAPAELWQPPPCSSSGG